MIKGRAVGAILKLHGFRRGLEGDWLIDCGGENSATVGYFYVRLLVGPLRQSEHSALTCDKRQHSNEVSTCKLGSHY